MAPVIEVRGILPCLGAAGVNWRAWRWKKLSIKSTSYRVFAATGRCARRRGRWRAKTRRGMRGIRRADGETGGGISGVGDTTAALSPSTPGIVGGGIGEWRVAGRRLGRSRRRLTVGRFPEVGRFLASRMPQNAVMFPVKHHAGRKNGRATRATRPFSVCPRFARRADYGRHGIFANGAPL